jgi:ABC-2 type transport system ATP-binding protein
MGTSAPVIASDRLTKFYGSTRGVEELTFDVQPGEVFGFLGPNGAGKTTTIRTMLDFIRPTSGAISVFGMDPRTDAPAIHARVGYLPGEFALYERMTGEEYLRTFSALRGGVPWSEVTTLAERLRLRLDARIVELSHGNKRKVGLIQAFMHRPDLLVMDEPTQGLDPLMQQEFNALVDEARQRGATVFLSSHIMPEVERICDRVAIIREGRLLTVSDIGDLKANALRRVTFHFAVPVAPGRFDALGSVVTAEARGDTVSMTVRGRLDEVVKEAARHDVVTVETAHPTLEDIFLSLYRDGEEA